MGKAVYSKLLKRAGVSHGFSERGDDSHQTFGELNVKSDSNAPDDPERVHKNRHKILKSVGLDGDDLVFLRSLSHGNTVFRAHKSHVGQEIDGYDSIITDEPIIIGLSVADCVPILLFDSQKNAVGIVHAGWRGSLANATGEAIKAMQRAFQTNPENIIAVVGPSICSNCYEVGKDVAELFDDKFISKKKDRLFLDLKAANQAQLKLNGVEKIEDLSLCTMELHEQFHSVRREGQTGRFMAFITPKK